MNKGTSSKREVTVEGAEGNEDKLHSLKCVACGGTDGLTLWDPCNELEEQWGWYGKWIDWDDYTNYVECEYKDTGLKYEMIRDLAPNHKALLDLVVCHGCGDGNQYEITEDHWGKSERHWNWESYGLREKHETMMIERWREGIARRKKRREEWEAKRRTYTQASLEAEGFSHIDEVRKYEYDDGGRKDAGWKGTGGDCVVRAVAIATGRPYQEVYDRCADGNHSGKKGQPFLNGKHYRNRTRGKRTALHGICTEEKWFQDYMKELGFEYVVAPYGQAHVRSDSLPQQGSLILSLKRHYAAYVDGVLRDTWDCSTIARRGSKHRKDGITRCVWGYWQRIA